LKKIDTISEDANNGRGRWEEVYEDASSSAQREMEAYEWALNDVKAIFRK
jgi:hypothetical protein